MALVPFSVAGPAASQDLEQRLMQVGPYSLVLRQRPAASGNTAHLATPQAGACPEQQCPQPARQRPDLSNVGLILWQSGFVLAEFLLLRRAAAAGPGDAGSCSWAGVRVLELGCGGGTVGMFLAQAGAQVVLTDQSHILPLTRENLAANFRARPAAPAAAAADGQPDASPGAPLPGASPAAAFAAAFGSAHPGPASEALQQARSAEAARRVFGAGPLVVPYSWGEPLQQLHCRIAAAAAERLAPATACDSDSGSPAGAPPAGAAGAAGQRGATDAMAHQAFDVVVGADLLYDPGAHEALLDTLQQLAAGSPHLQVFLAWRTRGLGEEAFEAAAAAAGWVTQPVPSQQMHPEFQDGSYKVVCMVKLP